MICTPRITDLLGPPAAVAAERTLITAMIHHPSLIDIDAVRGWMFGSPVRRVIARIARDEARAHTTPSPAMVYARAAEHIDDHRALRIEQRYIMMARDIVTARHVAIALEMLVGAEVAA